MGHPQYPGFSQFAVHNHAHQFYLSLFRSLITAALDFVENDIFFLHYTFGTLLAVVKVKYFVSDFLLLTPTVSLIAFLQYSATLRPFARQLPTHFFFKLRRWYILLHNGAIQTINS